MAHGAPGHLEQALDCIQTLPHLQRLVHRLGYEVSWEEIPPSAWLRRHRWSRSIRRAAVVGRQGGFIWYAIDTDDPASLARRVAGQLGRRGEHAGILALDPTRRQLAISVSFGPYPVLPLELAAPSRLALHCLERVSAAGPGKAIAAAARLAEALDAAEPGARFIRRFRGLFTAFAAHLPEAIPQGDRQRLALLQLTRVLFLYFVQNRGWLNGDGDFLRRGVDRCLTDGSDLHRTFFGPLFFGTLNQPYPRRTVASRRFGNIPFLNGGLFEPHWLERRYRPHISNALWSMAFDDLFERFHFTARERCEDHAIAPDMLDRVFEGMMDAEERKRTGTYYTPSALVRELLEAAIGAFLTAKYNLAADVLAGRIHERDPSLAAMTRTLTILDPAVGSGAFLLGALEWLADVRRDEGTTAVVRRRILAQNIFGVDTSTIAVTLTELRLWLAVLAEEHDGAPEAVEPLPNLDCLIRQGDSLSDPLQSLHSLSPRTVAGSRLLGEIRKRFVHATGPDKTKQARLLKQAESRALSLWLDETEAQLDRQLAECIATGKSKTLFGHRQGLDAPLQAHLRAVRAQRHCVRQARRRLERDRALPWFHYQSHFADIFASGGGFDIVIGNPPWIRAELLHSHVRQQLGRRFRWWSGRSGKGFRHQPDLALAFLERGLELAHRDGAVAFLLPAKLATAAYAKKARRMLARETTLHAVADLTPTHARSFDATIYPLAVVTTKGRPSQSHTVRSALAVSEAIRVPQHELRAAEIWIIKGDSVQRAMAELAFHPTIGERLVCHLGVKTGANAVFLNPDADVEPHLLRPALRGRDITAWSAEAKVSIIWTHDANGSPRTALPPLADSYFRRHTARLRGRADFRTGPPWQLFRVGPALAEYKVVWADIARRLEAVPLTPRTHRAVVPLNTCYLIPTKSAEGACALAAWLNSTWIRAAAAVRADPARGGFARFNARVVSSLPLPPAVLNDRQLAQLGDIARADPGAQASVDERAAHYLSLSPTACEALHGVVERATHDRC